MIRLNKTTMKLQVVLAGVVTANQLQVTSSFFDTNNEGNTTPGSTQQANTNDTTDVDVCNAPPRNYVRNIDALTVYNRDTASATIIVKTDDGGTEFILIRKTLTTLQTLQYEYGYGWMVI